nr:craniofacial development protein 2-like [Penaeus vannamei]
MTPGFSDDLQNIRDARKTAVIDRELSRLQMDIVALQESRLAGNGSVKEKDFTMLWQGKPPEDTREHGLGFALRNSLLGSVGSVSLISIHAPTLTSSAELKDKFYYDLNAITRSVPDKQTLLIAGDFNARVGTDHDPWPTCLGKFGTGKMNENGQRLRANLSSIKLTRTYQSADCDNAHSLACSKVKFQSRRLHHSEKEDRPHIDESKARDQSKVEEFAYKLEESFPGPPRPPKPMPKNDGNTSEILSIMLQCPPLERRLVNLQTGPRPTQRK